MPLPTDDAIRARAYAIWEKNGRMDGRDIDYWLQAARELEEEDRLLSRLSDDHLLAGTDVDDMTNPSPGPMTKRRKAGGGSIRPQDGSGV